MLRKQSSSPHFEICWYYFKGLAGGEKGRGGFQTQAAEPWSSLRFPAKAKCCQHGSWLARVTKRWGCRP